MTLVLPTADEALALAEQAILATRETVTSAVEEMVTQPRHVLLYSEGQEDMAHLAIQGVAKALVETILHSNPSLDNIVVLDSSEDGWSEVSPALDVTVEDELLPGFLHRSQSIIAFGSEFLHHSVVQPIARNATRFYAALQDGPEAEALIERVHPLREVVIL